MVSALVLLKTARGKVNEVGELLAQLKGVTEVYSVGGRLILWLLFVCRIITI